jgi:YHS domain-containing protein
MRWFVAFSMLGGLWAAGCTTQSYDSRHADVPLSGADIAQDAKYNQSDLVRGTRVNPRDGYKETYEGRTWWFVTDESRVKFHDDPMAFVGPRVDPVCQMAVDTRPAPFKEEFGGKTYFFDSMECRDKFHANPTAYVPAQGKPSEAEVK